MDDDKSLSVSEVDLLGFALCDCVVETDQESANYLRAVHRTALELATPNRFGSEIGGFWLMRDQLTQLRKLSACYPPEEAPRVARAVEAYIDAQKPRLLTCEDGDRKLDKPQCATH